jgi:hypothetical protein
LGCSFPIGAQVAKTSRDLADPLQIWQIPFVCSYNIILLSVRVYFYDTSVSVLQLRKRSLFAILVWKFDSVIGTSSTVTQTVMMVAKSKKNSIGQASYAVLIHFILRIWVHVTFGSLEWQKKK